MSYFLVHKFRHARRAKIKLTHYNINTYQPKGKIMRTLRLQHQMGSLAIIEGDGYKLIEYYIPDYTNLYVFTETGKQLMLTLLKLFALQGYTHVQLDSEPLMTIQELITSIENNYETEILITE